MASIRHLAQNEGLIVIASVHQPGWGTIAQFTDCLLLADGKTCYEGPLDELEGYLARFGVEVPKHVSC